MPRTSCQETNHGALSPQIEATVADLRAAGYNPHCMATWSANWDATNGYAFAKTAAALL
jgi:chitinase